MALVLTVETATASRAHAAACVFWARQLTDFSLRGDAWQWWDAAAGRYDRAAAPSTGAVLVFRKARGLTRGHVSTVSRVIDRRTVEVDHSWLSDNRLYRGMRVVDVSARNDWTEVRVWHPRLNDLGTTVYPTYGFVVADRPRPDLLYASIREAAPSAGERRGVGVEVSGDGDRSGRRPLGSSVGPSTRPGRFADLVSAEAPRPSQRILPIPPAPRRPDDAGAARIVNASLPVPSTLAPVRPAPPVRHAAAIAAHAGVALPAETVTSDPVVVAIVPARNPVRVAKVQSAAIREEISLAEEIAAIRSAAVATERLDFTWAADAHDERERLD